MLHHREVYQTNRLRSDFAIFYFNKIFHDRKVIFNCCHNIKPEIQDAFHPCYLLPEVARGAYFSWKGHIFCHEVVFRIDLPLALDVYIRLFIDSFDFMAVDKIMTPVRAQLSQNTHLGQSGLVRTEGHIEYF